MLRGRAHGSATVNAEIAATTCSNAESASTVVNTSQFADRADADRPFIDDRHATGEQTGGLDGDVALTTFEQVRLGEGEDGEHVVHRRPGDLGVSGPVRRGEERQQLPNVVASCPPSAAMRSMRAGVARNW